MALTGKNNEEKVWNYLKNKGLNDFAVAGLCGNIRAESGFSPINMQDSFEKKLGFTDKTYVAAVDNGIYNNFVRDSVGFGITQTTYWSRKQNLLEFAKSRGVSIGDLEMQLDFLWKELNELFAPTLAKLKKATSVKQASDIVLTEFEMPGDMGNSMKNLRAGYGQEIYERYASKSEKGSENNMTEQKAIQALIATATAEIGYLEKKTNAQLDDKTANAGSGNYTKYWRDVYENFQSLAWCACFVSWCFMKTFGLETSKKLLKHWPYTYVPSLMSLFPRHSNPKVGDIVGFYRNGEFAHTGLVIAVDGDNFTTIEGNTSGGSTIIPNGGGVCKKTYNNNNLPGTKFVSPDYSIVTKIISPATPAQPSKPESSPTLSETPKFNAKTIKGTRVYTYPGSGKLCSFSPLKKGTVIGVCDSLKGPDGKEYYFIKYNDLLGFVAAVNVKKFDVQPAQEFDKTYAGTYETIAKVNLRSSADKTSTANIITAIPKGKAVNSYGYYNMNGKDVWLYVTYEGITGYVVYRTKYYTKK